MGQSGNVGLGGMFVFAAKCPPLGAEVEVEFAIPAFDGVPKQLRFCCKGQVIRVESCYEVTGFAVTGRIDGELPAENEQLNKGLEQAAGVFLIR